LVKGVRTPSGKESTQILPPSSNRIIPSALSSSFGKAMVERAIGVVSTSAVGAIGGTTVEVAGLVGVLVVVAGAVVVFEAAGVAILVGMG
jgi:hypothetical protein